MASRPPDPAAGPLRRALPWIGGALLVVGLLLLYVWWTAPTPDRLPTVYSVL